MQKPTDETMQHFQALQREIRTSSKRGTRVRYLCSELLVLMTDHPSLSELLDPSVASTMRFHTR